MRRHRRAQHSRRRRFTASGRPDSILHASTIPNCITYDPAYAYEIAIIVQDGIRRMYQDGESIFYYLTLYNENYPMPAMPAGLDPEGVLRGMYRFKAPDKGKAKRTPVRQRSDSQRSSARPSDSGGEVQRGLRCMERHEL